MKKKKVFISEASVKMIEMMNNKIREIGCKAVNFYIFLYGLIKFMDENGKTAPLYNYLKDNDISFSEIDEALEASLLIYYGETDEEKENLSEVVKCEKKEFEAEWTFEDEKRKKHRLKVDEEVYKIFICLMNLINESDILKIEPIHFTIAMFMSNSMALRLFIESFDLDYADSVNYFSKEKAFDSVEFIPFELSGFLSVLNDRINTNRPCEILMRDGETNTLWNIMLKMNKRNAIIVGEPGVGKTALVEKITYDIKAGTCPPEFKDFKVVILDVNSLIAGTSYRGDSELRIQKMIEFLERNPKIILFIDEVHTILGAGACFDGGLDLSNALKPILARGDTIVIGSTTSDEYELYFMRDAALSRRFERVNVSEPNPKDVYPMIKNKIKHLSEFHDVKITRKMVEYVIMIAGCFAFEKKNPDKTLDLIDRAMVTAKRNGKNKVDKESVLSNFGIYFKMWENMSDDSKKEIAYHELGHYIMCKASENLVDYEIQAVSIMPAEGYLGVTVFNIDDEKVPFTNLDYYIDVIAEDLAGRVAESLFRKTYTAGASSDLRNATKTAFMIVTRLGMGSESIKNRIFLNSVDYPMFTEKSTNAINDEVNNLIEKAFNRATEVIEANKDILEAMVKELLKKQIMSEEELDRIWQRVLKKRLNKEIISK